MVSDEMKDLLQQFRGWVSLLEVVKGLNEQVLDSSIEIGKWSIRDIIIHIMVWDKYFYEEAIHMIVTGQEITLIHRNFDEFNDQSITYGRTITTDELIEKSQFYRMKIIEDIETLSEKSIIHLYKDGDGNIFQVLQYVKDFIWHDEHHLVPLREYLKNKGEINMMRHDLEVSQSIEINAGTLKVWEALTNPEIIKEYLFGTETVTDWKVGSEIIFQGEYEGHKYRDKGIIIENKFHEVISYSYWSGFSGLEDNPNNYCLVTYKLDKMDTNHTKLTWTQRGYANEDGYNHSKNGTEELLKQIKTIVER